MSDRPLTETPADPHHDPRPWQDCTRKNIRKGDLVETLIGDRLRWGVAHHQDSNGDWLTERGYPITYGDLWPLRRNPAPTAEKDTTMTETPTPADPRRWRECRFDDIEKGDRVRWAFTENDHGTFEMVEGVAHEMRKHKGSREWVDAEGTAVAAAPAHGTEGFRYWRLAGHESTAPTPPAEEVELPREPGAVLRDVRVGPRRYEFAVKLYDGWRAYQGPDYALHPDHNGTFLRTIDMDECTLPDGTRARRAGVREDGTLRFVKVQEEK